MTESTSEYKKRIEEIKQSIENEPYMAKMREDIAEGISKTGIRQATVEEQFQSVLDETTGKDVIIAPEIILARNGEADLKTRLDKEKQEVTAQLAEKARQIDLNQTKIELDGANQRIDNLVIPISPENANLEVTDAHVSIPKAKTFPSLTERIADTESDSYFPIRNYIGNGDFREGVSGWASLGGSSTLSASGNILSIIGKGTNAQPAVFKETLINNVIGKKIYVKAQIKMSDIGATGARLRIGGTTSGSISVDISNMNQNEEYFFSGIVTLTSAIVGNIRLSIMHVYNTPEESLNKVMYVRNVLAIDLSETFGYGNEPSKDFMDKTINLYKNMYFDKTANASQARATLPILKDLSEELNSFKNTQLNKLIFDNESDEKIITINTNEKNMLFLHVQKILDTSLVIKSNGNDKLITDLQTGISSKKIATIGYYQIDVSDVDSVQISNSISTNGAKSTVSFIFDKIPRMPYQIKSPEKKSFEPATFERNLPNTVVQEVSKGFVYTSNGSTLRKSDDWGTSLVDVYNFSADIKRVAVLDNGNILVLLKNGELYLSQDDGATFTKNTTFIATSAKLPHDLFGVEYYENIVLLTPYAQIPSGDPGKEVYMSLDWGVTFKRIFSLLDYADIPTGMSHIHSATYDPWEKLIWVCSGDGGTAQMIFYSNDLGVTWYKAKKQGYLENQSTVIIPLKDCVLFTSDARLVGVMRYIRPSGGTPIGSDLHFDMPFILAEKWGKNVASEVPIGSTAVIDYEKSVAYFSWAVLSSAFSGRVDGALNYSEVYATDGYNFNEVYRRDAVTQQSVYGIYGDLSHDKKIIIKSVHVDYVNSLLNIDH